MATYPAHRENDVVLRDGSTVHVRPSRPDDAPAMEQLLEGLSDRSRWLRFFSGFPNLEHAVRWATEVDYEHRYGLVATTGGDGHLVGHAGWEREADRPERAEVALEIVDAMQSKGLGTILLGQLAEAAHQAGVEVLTAEVLPENHLMIKVFRDCGFPVRTDTVPGGRPGRVPGLDVAGGPGAVRAAGAGGGHGGHAGLPGPSLGGGDRCLPAARQRRRGAVP
jgi:acetate---CoA ligase (ADP-forming)